MLGCCRGVGGGPSDIIQSPTRPTNKQIAIISGSCHGDSMATKTFTCTGSYIFDRTHNTSRSASQITSTYVSATALYKCSCEIIGGGGHHDNECFSAVKPVYGRGGGGGGGAGKLSETATKQENWEEREGNRYIHTHTRVFSDNTEHLWQPSITESEVTWKEGSIWDRLH